MKDILQDIILRKKKEVAQQKEAVSVETLFAMGSSRLSRNTYSMRESLAKSRSGIIAEFKRKSPSKGWINPEIEVSDVIPEYVKNGASACSVLTDTHFFGGGFRDLQQARSLASIPLLRKDFIIDPYQVYQARVFGADAILLIAACLTPEQCFSLAKSAHEIHLEVLLEIHHENELTHLNPYIDMLGVNNRNLGTFHTDIENSFRMADAIKDGISKAGMRTTPLLVAESGISEPQTITLLRRKGFEGFLIGETFMRTNEPGKTLYKFIEEIG